MTVSLLGQYDALRRIAETLQNRIQDATTEVGSGKKANLPEDLGAELRPYIDMRNSRALVDARLSLVGVGISRIQALTDAVQQVRNALDATAQAVGGGLSNPQQAFFDATSSQGKSTLEAITTALNSQYGARFMFSGDAVDQKPLINTQSLIGTVKQVIEERRVADGGALIDLNALQADIDSIFDNTNIDPSRHFATLYQGGTGYAPSLRVNNTETVEYTLRANDVSFRQAMKQAVMAAVSSDVRAATGTKGIGSTISEEYVNKLFINTRNAQDKLTDVQALLGSREQYVTNIKNSLQKEQDTFDTRLGDYEGIDMYQITSKLNNYKTQLEALYNLIAQMKQLSLVNFL